MKLISLYIIRDIQEVKQQLRTPAFRLGSVRLKDARGYMDVLGEVIFQKLAEGEDVALFELGKLKVVESPAREVLKNPKQPELGKKICPAHNVVKYSISAKLKEAVK